MSEKLYKGFIKSAIAVDESIKTGDCSKGTPDNYIEILTKKTVYNLLDYCYEKNSSLLIEVISRSLYYNHFSDKIGDEIPCRILNFLFKKFVEHFNP